MVYLLNKICKISHLYLFLFTRMCPL